MTDRPGSEAADPGSNLIRPSNEEVADSIEGEKAGGTQGREKPEPAEQRRDVGQVSPDDYPDSEEKRPMGG